MSDDVYEYLGQFFEWDRMKAARNVIRHQVRVTEAASVFFDEHALFEPDPDHSEDENHYIVLGWSIRRALDGSACNSQRTHTPHQRQNGNSQ